MSKNIKLGNDTLTGVDTLRVEDADTSGVYDEFLDTSDANAAASDIKSGKTAYVNGSKVTGTGVTPSGTINITENGTVDVTNYTTANVAVVSGYVTTPNAYGDTVEIGEGGGQQPQLYAPTVVGGSNSIEWSNNANNGAFGTVVGTIDGSTVTSPLTITQEMDGKTLVLTCSETNFQSATTSIILSYISVTGSLLAVDASQKVSGMNECVAIGVEAINSSAEAYFNNEALSYPAFSAKIASASDSTTITGNHYLLGLKSGTCNINVTSGWRTVQQTSFVEGISQFSGTNAWQNQITISYTIYDATAEASVKIGEVTVSAYQNISSIDSFAVVANHKYYLIVNATVAAKA